MNIFKEMHAWIVVKIVLNVIQVLTNAKNAEIRLISNRMVPVFALQGFIKILMVKIAWLVMSLVKHVMETALALHAKMDSL